jgi:hypothetical protein
MVAKINPFWQTIETQVARIQNADGTSVVTLASPGADGSDIQCLIVTSTDTSAQEVQIVLTVSAVVYPLYTISVTARAGDQNNKAPINMFDSSSFPGLILDARGNRVLRLDSGQVLGFKLTTGSVTAAKQISALVGQVDFVTT